MTLFTDLSRATSRSLIRPSVFWPWLYGVLVGLAIKAGRGHPSAHHPICRTEWTSYFSGIDSETISL